MLQRQQLGPHQPVAASTVCCQQTLAWSGRTDGLPNSHRAEDFGWASDVRRGRVSHGNRTKATNVKIANKISTVILPDTETVRAVTLVLSTLLQCLNDKKLTSRAKHLQTVCPHTPDLQQSRRKRPWPKSPKLDIGLTDTQTAIRLPVYSHTSIKTIVHAT